MADMNLHRAMCTDRRLWFAFAVIAFILLGFVHLHTENVEHKIGPTSFWKIVVLTPTCSTFEEFGFALSLMAVYGSLTAIPAMVFGWVAQAIVVTVRSGRKSGNRNQFSSYDSTKNHGE